MTRLPIVLVGGGGQARATLDVIEQHGAFTIVGLVGTPDEVGSQVLGYPVVANDDGIRALRGVASHAMVTVGQIKSPEPRMRLFALLEEGGWELPAVVSPRGYVSRHATIGAGTIVMHGAVVNAGASVGRNCIINTNALVEHDAVVADHCHISTGATLNSGVQVGTGTFIGSGSTVRQGIAIGARCVVGMGQRVLRDCPDGSQLPPRRVT